MYRDIWGYMEMYRDIKDLGFQVPGMIWGLNGNILPRM